MKIIKQNNSAEILNSDIYTVTQTSTDMYAVWSSCNSRQKKTAGRKKGSKTTTTKRIDNINNLKRTFKRNRDLINCNFTGGSNSLFITLTYADRTVKGKAGAKRVNKDVDGFLHRLKYVTYKGNMRRATKCLYWFLALEPQADGVWHLHCLFQWQDREHIYIANNSLNHLWGHGFVKVNTIKGVSNIGAYLSAYLTNVVVNPKQAIKNTHWTRRHEHMIEKGGRLNMYPAGVRLCRHSRNLQNPSKFCATGVELRKIATYEGWQLNGCKTVQIKTDSVCKNPCTGKHESLIIEVKQFYFSRAPEVAQKYKLIRQVAKIKHKTIAEILDTTGFSNVFEIFKN